MLPIVPPFDVVEDGRTCASRVIAPSMVCRIAHPITRRERRSSTTARYRQPSPVAMYVMSPIQTRFSAGTSSAARPSRSNSRGHRRAAPQQLRSPSPSSVSTKAVLPSLTDTCSQSVPVPFNATLARTEQRKPRPVCGERRHRSQSGHADLRWSRQQAGQTLCATVFLLGERIVSCRPPDLSPHARGFRDVTRNVIDTQASEQLESSSKGHVTTQYYGWYANRPRRLRRQAAPAPVDTPPIIIPAPRLALTEASRRRA